MTASKILFPDYELISFMSRLTYNKGGSKLISKYLVLEIRMTQELSSVLSFT